MIANPPDLAVVSVEHLRDYSKVGQIVRGIPNSNLPTAFFLVRLSNIGKGPFCGGLGLEWTDQASKIDSNKFTNYSVSSIPSDVIYVGDTISIGFSTHHRFYSIGTHLKFRLIVTKNYISSSSTINNIDYSPIFDMAISNSYSEITISSDRDLFNGIIFDIH